MQETPLCLPNMVLFYLLGAMVNISSNASTSGNCRIVYTSTKGALDQITRCMAVELGPYNIRVNAVNPTLVEDTPMSQDIFEHYNDEVFASLIQGIPLKRMPHTEDVVNAVLFLLSDKSDMINGSFLKIDGGKSCT